MLHEARDRQKFLSDVQYLRDMQHKVESEYQACLRRQEHRRDPNEQKQDQFGWQETNFERSRLPSRSSSKQSSGEEDPLAEPRLSSKNSAMKCDSRLPAIDQTPVKQKHKSTMTTRKPEGVGPSKPSPGDSSEHPLFCVEYTPYCSVFAFSPAPQPSANYCCLVLPLVPPAAPVAQGPSSPLPSVSFPSFPSPAPAPAPPGPVPESPAALCYFPVSSPTPAETPVLCLPGPSRPTARPPQILSRRRRPNLRRLTVSPDVRSPGASGDESGWKSQLPTKVALRGADPVPQEDPMWTSDTKLKRPTRERRTLVLSSQPATMTTETTPERARKGDSCALLQNEPHPAPSQAFLGTNRPQVLSESLGSPPFTTTMGESRRAPFRFRDEDFYSVLSLSHGADDDDTEEETHMEEELLLVGMYPPQSPSHCQRSQFLGTSATRAKYKNFEDHPENCSANSVRKIKSSYGSLRVNNVMEPVRDQAPVRQRMFQDPRLTNGGSASESNSGDSENEEKTFRSQDTKFVPNLDDDLNTDNVFSDCTSMEDRPGTHGYERGWQTYLNNSSASLDYFLSGRPRSSRNSFYNTPGSLTHSAMTDDIPAHLLRASTLVHSPDSEGHARFNVHQPFPPTRNRNLLVRPENHCYFLRNSAHELDVRGAEANTLTSQSQGAALYTGHLLLNPQNRLSLVESSSSSASRMNLQGHLSVPRPLQENIPFTAFTVSDFLNQNGSESRRAASGLTDGKEATQRKADPEKLKKLQESLLEEDEEEEGDLCRICQIPRGSPTNPLLEPCGCVGSLRFVHQECLKKWLKVKITSGADLGAVKTCEMCKQGLLVDLNDFNLTEFYQKHQRSQAQNELMNSGLYLVLLLHLYEQRFAELLRLNYSRATREQLSRNFLQPRPEGNESSELGDGSESNIYQSNSRVI